MSTISKELERNSKTKGKGTRSRVVSAAPSQADVVKPDDKPPATLTEWILRYLWRSKYAKPLAFGLIAVVLLALGWSLLPSSIQEKLILSGVAPKRMESHYSPGDFEIIARRTVVDFRSWRKVPPKFMTTVRYSPVFYTSTLQVEKKTNADHFVNNHWTRGFTLDVACQTPDCEVKQVEGRYKPGEIKYNKFELSFDVSKIATYEPFTVSYQAIYWNTFQNRSESAGLTISNPTRQAVFEIWLPFAVPKDKLSFTHTKKDDNNNPSLVENPDFTLEGTHLIWTIKNPLFDEFYEVKWDWNLENSEQASPAPTSSPDKHNG